MVSTRTILLAAQAIILVQAIPTPASLFQKLMARTPQDTTGVTPSAVPTTGPIKALPNAGCTSVTDGCSGDLTHYDGSFGTNTPSACGHIVDTNGTNIIALPFAFMGPLSNNNPLCGRQITVFNPATGKTSVGTLDDKCEGCVARSLDVTNKMFFELTGFNFGSTDSAQGVDPGRIQGVEWFFS